MPTLEIPYIPALDSETAVDSIINILDEHGIRRSLEHVNWPLYPYRPLTTFTCAHSGQYIYIDFFVRCNYLRAENYRPQSPVSEDSCVEFFVDPRSDGHYWNFEFNCIGAINASHRTDRHNPTRLTPEELAQIRVYPSCGTRPFKELEGLFTWNILVAIPLSLIGVEYKGTPLPMRANFYKCASATSLPHYLSWAPVSTPAPDFHRPEFFAPVTLA